MPLSEQVAAGTGPAFQDAAREQEEGLGLAGHSLHGTWEQNQGAEPEVLGLWPPHPHRPQQRPLAACMGGRGWGLCPSAGLQGQRPGPLLALRLRSPAAGLQQAVANLQRRHAEIRDSDVVLLIQ